MLLLVGVKGFPGGSVAVQRLDRQFLPAYT